MIDSHTHFFPEEVAKAPQAWALKHNESYWWALVGKRPDGKPSLQGFPSEKKFLSDMDEAGIDYAIIQGWYWEHSQTCIEQNIEISKLIKRHPDRLGAFASIQPADAITLQIVESARDMGFLGLGEIHDGVQNFSFKSDLFEKILNLAEVNKLAISIHITEQTTRQYLGKTPTDTLSAVSVAKNFPKINFIFAHWCGNLAFEGVVDNIANIYFDTAATQFTAPKNAFTLAQENQALSTKTIYGSDYPLRLYPRLFKYEEMKTAVDFAKGQISKKFEKNLFAKTPSKVIKKL